jgi:hypothetical protein
MFHAKYFDLRNVWHNFVETDNGGLVLVNSSVVMKFE